MSGNSGKGKIIVIAVIAGLFIASGISALVLILTVKKHTAAIASQSTTAAVTTAAATTTTTTTESTNEETATTSEETTETTDTDKTLEEVIDPSVVKAQEDKEKAKDSFKKTYKDLKIEASGNTYVIKYYYKQTYSAKQMASIKNSLDTSGMKDKLNSYKDWVATTYGKRPDKILVIYYNGDGTEIVSIESQAEI